MGKFWTAHIRVTACHRDAEAKCINQLISLSPKICLTTVPRVGYLLVECYDFSPFPTGLMMADLTY